MWPPAWGHFFWFMRHAAAYTYLERSEPFTSEELEHIRYFLQAICLFLPCPACSIHCGQYMVSHPVDQIDTPEKLWEYDVTFHNAVNQRLGKREVSGDEAKTLLQTQWKDRGGQDEFLFDYWLVPLLCTNRMAAGESATEAERAAFKRFLVSCIYMMPFAMIAPNVRQTLLAKLDSAEMDFTNQMAAVGSITKLYNAVCQSFGHATQTPSEMDGRWKKALMHEYPLLVRSYQIREEDHKKMAALQAELHNKTPNRVTEVGSNGWRTACIILAVLLSLCILVMVVSYIIYRFSGTVPFCPKTSLSPFGKPTMH
jgi:hypothetical protein